MKAVPQVINNAGHWTLDRVSWLDDAILQPRTHIRTHTHTHTHTPVERQWRKSNTKIKIKIHIVSVTMRQRIMKTFSVYILTIIYPSNDIWYNIQFSSTNVFSKIRSHTDGLGLTWESFSSVWQVLCIPDWQRSFIHREHDKYPSSSKYTFHHETNLTSALMGSSIHHWRCKIDNSCGSTADVNGKSMVRITRYLTIARQLRPRHMHSFVILYRSFHSRHSLSRESLNLVLELPIASYKKWLTSHNVWVAPRKTTTCFYG